MTSNDCVLVKNSDENNIIKLIQDASDKLVVKIERKTLIKEVKKYFKWRKGDMLERFYSQGTSKYDAFISYLVSKGY